MVQNSSDDYAILAQTNYVDGDVSCNLIGTRNAWAFQIKDCSNYMPAAPLQPIGPDTLCTTTDSTSIYIIENAQGAWYYEWQILPTEAGIFQYDSSQTNATLHWSSNWEGQAEISARSWNDCGQSAWSEIKPSWAYSCLGIPGNPEPGPRNLYIFPNPAQNEVNCQLSIVNCQLSMLIYDLYGRVIEEKNIPAGQTQTSLDISNYPPGVYLAVLKDETGIVARGKFVKK